jgi:peptide/nickel transport system ATP-binding protein
MSLNLSYVFITHDISLIRNIATRVAVMYLGEFCEVAANEDLFASPSHPYTQTLLAAVPVVSEEEEQIRPNMEEVRGEIPSPMNIPEGCSFHTRCPEAMPICSSQEPREIEISPGHQVSCHLY